MHALQGSLFAGGTDIGFDPAFPTLRRIELEEDAWIDVVPGWVTGADELFARTLNALDWRGGTEHIRTVGDVERPRLVANFSDADLPPELDVVRGMGAALSRRYQVDLPRITCNLYRDGRDSVAWHGDRVARELPSATVAVLTLGAPRPFRVRRKGGGPSRKLLPGPGDVVVMGGSCQRTHDHAVPKVAQTGPRIAVMFREAWDLTQITTTLFAARDLDRVVRRRVRDLAGGR